MKFAIPCAVALVGMLTMAMAQAESIPTGVSFAPTFTLGSIINLVGQFIQGGMVIVGMFFAIRYMTRDITELKLVTTKLADSYQAMALTLARMESYDRRLTRLEDKKP